MNKEIDKLKKESPNNNMKIFIKSLICILFDYETAQNPRKIITYDKKYGYGSTGVLQKKFDNYEDKKKTGIKGIRCPITGDTLEDWIKNVDVDFIEE